MGSPVSPVVADLYMEFLETQLEELLNIMNIGSAGQLIKFCNFEKTPPVCTTISTFTYITGILSCLASKVNASSQRKVSAIRKSKT